MLFSDEIKKSSTLDGLEGQYSVTADRPEAYREPVESTCPVCHDSINVFSHETHFALFSLRISLIRLSSSH